MTYAHETVEDRTLTTAAVTVASTLAVPALVAALVPALLPIMVPMAIILPFATMTVLEGSVEKHRQQA